MLLIEAVQQGRTRQLKLLIKVGIDLNQTDEMGQTALIHSCFVEDDRLRKIAIRTLVISGCDINKRDIFGRSALSWACLYGRKDAVNFLLNSSVCFDIEVDVSDKDGNSTLLLAVMSNSFPVVQLVMRVLKETGNVFQMHRSNNAGISPLVLAFLRGDKKCAEFLIKDGAAPVSSVLHFLKRSDVPESLPAFCPTQVAWIQRGAITSTRSARRRQMLNLSTVSEDDVLQFLFAESKIDASNTGKEPVQKTSLREQPDAEFNKSTCRERRPTTDSNQATTCSESKCGEANGVAKKCPHKQRNAFPSHQESPMLKLFALYSDVHSPSYRQGYPDIHHQPAPEIVEESTADPFDGSRSARTSISALSSDDVFDDAKESAMDRHLRLKYARSSRATSLQVGILPPIGLSGLRPGRMKRTRSSTTIKRF